MRITDIITEDASAGATASGNIATLAFPMTPGTTHAQAIKAVDPFGKIFKNAKKKRKEIYKMGYILTYFQNKSKRHISNVETINITVRSIPY